jgi:hypothetical protein
MWRASAFPWTRGLWTPDSPILAGLVLPPPPHPRNKKSRLAGNHHSPPVAQKPAILTLGVQVLVDDSH